MLKIWKADVLASVAHILKLEDLKAWKKLGLGDCSKG